VKDDEEENWDEAKKSRFECFVAACRRRLCGALLRLVRLEYQPEIWISYWSIKLRENKKLCNNDNGTERHHIRRQQGSIYPMSSSSRLHTARWWPSEHTQQSSMLALLDWARPESISSLCTVCKNDLIYQHLNNYTSTLDGDLSQTEKNCSDVKEKCMYTSESEPFDIKSTTSSKHTYTHNLCAHLFNASNATLSLNGWKEATINDV
jgi:hypothetical protein